MRHGRKSQGITAGADNAMWFVDAGANSVGEISITSHAVTMFPDSDEQARAARDRARCPMAGYGSPKISARQIGYAYPLDGFDRHHIHFVAALDRIERLEAFGHLAEHRVVFIEKASVG